MSNVYEDLDKEPIEYQLYALDKLIKKHEALDTMMSDIVARAANRAIINKHISKRDELIKSLSIIDIDWNNIKVVQSLCCDSDKENWEMKFYPVIIANV